MASCADGEFLEQRGSKHEPLRFFLTFTIFFDTMATDIENFDDDEEMDASANEFFDEENSENAAPQVRDYSERRVLIWEEDDVRRNACLEALSDLLVGATIKAVKTEAEATAEIENDDWDTFVVDFYTEGVSSSDFIKSVNNYPGSILVAIAMAPLTLPDERDPAKMELLRRLFDLDRPSAQLHG